MSLTNRNSLFPALVMSGSGLKFSPSADSLAMSPDSCDDDCGSPGQKRKPKIVVSKSEANSSVTVEEKAVQTEFDVSEELKLLAYDMETLKAFGTLCLKCPKMMQTVLLAYADQVHNNK